MIKKEYIQPNTDVFNTELQPVLAGSLQDNFTNNDDKLHVDPDKDNDDGDNRSRRSYNTWDDEDEEYDY